jgi:intracellular sulfur oxidation DsrE/DsrF family protein
MTTELSDERLNAMIDGETTPAEAETVLERMRADASLRERICQLRLTKDLVRHAYAGIAPPQRQPSRAGSSRRPWRIAAALAVFATGALLGWTAREGFYGPAEAPMQIGAQATPADGGELNRVVLHLSSAAPEKGRAILDHAEGIFEAARASGRSVSVEIVANGGGLDLLREGVSAHSDRIARLRAAYPSLALIACGQTAQRLRETGIAVHLLPGTIVETSALDEIVRRMQQGWAYVRI